MVNTNIIGAIPIDGQGFVAKKNGNYEAGQYKRLTNVELKDGVLRGRRSVKSVDGETPGSIFAANSNLDRMIGYMNDNTIAASTMSHLAFNTKRKIELWSPTLISAPSGANSFHKLVGYFRYNYKNYWIDLRYSSDVSTYIRFRIYSGAIDSLNDQPETYATTTYFNSLSFVEPLEFLPSSADFNKFDFKNFFLAGERLWIVTSIGVYFSKATDPTKFAVVDGGGFFKFPDSKINHAFSLNNVVYVMTDNSIHTISYNTDPNTDAVVRRISDMGADHGCVFENIPFVINQVGIYSIQNNYLEKFMDNDFDLGEDYYLNNLTAFEDYLIVNKFVNINYEKYEGIQTNGSRTNLVTNPSGETGTTGYTNSSDLTYATSTEQKYVGNQSIKVSKSSDFSNVAHRNLWINPNYEVSASTVDPVAGIATLVTTPAPVTGTKCLKLTKDPANDQDFYFYLNREYVELDPTKTYKLQLKYRWTGTIPSGANPIISKFEEGPGQPTKNSKLVTFKSWAKDTWHTLNIDLTVDSLYPFFSLRIFDQFFPTTLSNTFAVFIDSVSIKETPVGLPAEYETAGTFFDGDTADTSLLQYNWDGTPGLSSTTVTGGPGSNPKLYYKYNQFVNVTPSVSHTIGLAFYPYATQDMTLYVEQYKADNSLKAATPISLGSFTANQWTYVAKTFTPDSDVTKIKFYLTSTVNNVPGNSVYVDSLIVEKTSTYTGYFDGSFPSNSNVTYAWSGTAHASTSTYSILSVLRRLYATGRLFVPFEKNNSLGYNTYFVNMRTGAVHVFDFTDARSNNAQRGYPVEYFVNPTKDSSGNYNLYFMVTRKISETSTAINTSSYFYYLNSYYDNQFTDFAFSVSNVLGKYAPKVEIEIDSYAPDGSEYLVKKFRSIQLEAKYPSTDFNIQFGFDNQALGSLISVSQDASDRPHSSSRIGINQRCRALTVKLGNANSNVSLAAEAIYGAVEISSMQTYWGYTQHAPTTRGKGL